jgi:predicted component of type VI protein secretion system
MATLIVSIGGRELQKLPITKTTTYIGRDMKCDLQLDNPTISRQQARLISTENGFRIDNLSRTSTLSINGKDSQFSLLNNGDKVDIGKFTLKFIVEGGLKPDQLEVVHDPLPPQPISPSETVHLDPEYLAKVRARLKTNTDSGNVSDRRPTEVGNYSPSPWLWVAILVALSTILIVGLR